MSGHFITTPFHCHFCIHSVLVSLCSLALCSTILSSAMWCQWPLSRASQVWLAAALLLTSVIFQSLLKWSQWIFLVKGGRSVGPTEYLSIPWRPWTHCYCTQTDPEVRKSPCSLHTGWSATLAACVWGWNWFWRNPEPDSRFWVLDINLKSLE